MPRAEKETMKHWRVAGSREAWLLFRVIRVLNMTVVIAAAQAMWTFFRTTS